MAEIAGGPTLCVELIDLSDLRDLGLDASKSGAFHGLASPYQHCRNPGGE